MPKSTLRIKRKVKAFGDDSARKGNVDCLFCKIIDHKVSAKIIHETDQVLAFLDINPQAAFHALVIPRKHIERASKMEASDTALIGELIYQAKVIAEKNGYLDYRLVINNGAEAGQTVFHIHLHVLAGRKMAWPPG